MFKPVTMSKVCVLGLKDHLERITAALAAADLVHLEKVETLPEFAERFTVARDEELERKYRALAERYEACQTALGAVHSVDIQSSDLVFDLAKEIGPLSATVVEIHEACDAQTARRKELQDEEKHLAHLRNLMEMLGGFDVSLSALQHMRLMKVTLGIVAQEKLGLLLEGLKDRFIATDRKVRPSEHLVMVVADRGDQALLEKVLTAAFFQELILPEEFSGNPAEISQRIQGRVAQIASAKEKVTAELGQIRSRYAAALSTLAKKIHCARLHFFARDHFKNSRDALILTGWLPKERAGDLRAFLAASPDGKDLMGVQDDSSLGKTVKVPTLLKNAWLIRPFENILKIYGLPNYREMDPTFYTTIGFMLMFGMMFGDVGHGLVLGSLGAWLRWGKLGRKAATIKDVGFLLLACGGASATFGLLFGSVFGFEHVVRPLWFNPFEDLHYGLTVAIAWGVAFIVGGAIINIANRVSNGQYIEAGLGRTGLVGIWFYLGSVTLLAGVIAGIAPLKTFAALTGLCLLPMLLIGLKEPLEAWHHARAARHHSGEHVKSSVLEIFILSVMEIYDTILSYLSNTLSFMRVGAFALNHVALLLAVFAMAQILKEMTGSGFVYWAMVCAGNLGVIVVEGVIVLIQTLRLIYYEGFSKFFSGDGVAYQPFSLSTSVKN